MKTLAIAFLLLWIPGAAWADELRPSSVDFVQIGPSQWTLGWKRTLLASDARSGTLPRLPPSCAPTAAPRMRISPAATIGFAKIACDDRVAGKGIGLPNLRANEDAIVRIAPLDRPVQTYRLTAREPLAIIAARPDRWQVWRSYFAIGVDHIVTGWDHLLFVIALVLLMVRGGGSVHFGRVVGAATAFTVAHSVTLVATTLGWTGLAQQPVEALIALSIVVLAVELAKDRESLTARHPWAVAFGFGLLHGFGFAGALREIGLPDGEVPAALLSFNLGVEAGQVAIIVAVLLFRTGIMRFAPRLERTAIRLIGYGIGLIGAYWLVDRVVG